MSGILDVITSVNDKINGFVWVTIGLWLLIGTGIIMSFLLLRLSGSKLNAHGGQNFVIFPVIAVNKITM